MQLDGFLADKNLRFIVKAYDFGGTIETFDPFSKLPMKKAAKAFLVENSVRRFEQMRIQYPRSDDKYTAALLGYIVKRMSSSGVPVYEQRNESAGDHWLDAVNLSLVAFTLEKTEFGQPKGDTHIAFTGRLGLFNTPSDPYPGGKDRPRPNPHRKVKEQEPPVGRAEGLGGDRVPGQQKSIPGSHLSTGTTPVRLWDWPGFLRDEPPPKVPTNSEAWKRAKQRVLGSPRREPPRRKKF